MHLPLSFIRAPQGRWSLCTHGIAKSQGWTENVLVCSVCCLFSSKEQQLIVVIILVQGLWKPPFIFFYLPTVKTPCIDNCVCVCAFVCVCVCVCDVVPVLWPVLSPKSWSVTVTLGQACWLLHLSKCGYISFLLKCLSSNFPFFYCFSSSEQKQLLILLIVSPFSFLCNINFEGNFKIWRKDMCVFLISSFCKFFFLNRSQLTLISFFRKPCAEIMLCQMWEWVPPPPNTHGSPVSVLLFQFIFKSLMLRLVIGCVCKNILFYLGDRWISLTMLFFVVKAVFFFPLYFKT